MQQTARQPALAPAADLAELTRLCRTLTGLCETAARTALTAEQWDYLSAAVLELSGRVRHAGFGVTLAAAERAAERAEGFQEGFEAGRRRAPRHRRGQGQLWPAPVPGASRAVLPVAVAAGLHWARGHALHAMSAVAAAAAVTISAAGMVTLPDVHAAPPVPPRHAVVASLVPAGAILIRPVAARRPRTAGASVPVSGAATPAASRRPSPGPLSSAASPGVLDVTQEQVTLRPEGPGELSGQVDLSADGGPVSWSASVPGADLAPFAGSIPAGSVQVVTITVAAGTAAGSAVATFTAAGATTPVTVTWQAPRASGLSPRRRTAAGSPSRGARAPRGARGRPRAAAPPGPRR